MTWTSASAALRTPHTLFHLSPPSKYVRRTRFRVLRTPAWLTAPAVAAMCFAAQPSSGQVLAGGSNHSVAVRPDGTVWAWGTNSDGQLGDGSTVERRVPTDTGLTGVASVGAGEFHSFALTANGDVYAWGRNSSGQLGDGTTVARLVPTAITGLANITAVAAGFDFSVALDATGQVWTWGANGSGQLGQGTTIAGPTPVAVASMSNVVSIAAGQRHVVAIKADGTVWTWGVNASGQLGDGTTTQRNAPTQVAGIITAVQAAAGVQHSVVRLSDGTLRSWGYNNFGNLGDGTYAPRLTPVAVTGLTNVTSVVVRGGHNLAVRSDGSLHGWGPNGGYLLGDGTQNSRLTPIQILGGGVSFAAAGASHSMAVTTTGVVLTWGSNANGRLGDGTTESGLVPQAISEAAYLWMVGKPTVSVAAGTYTIDQAVTIACATPEASLYYTLDGSEPTSASSSIVSGGTVTIDRTTSLRVRGFSTVFAPSRQRASTYTMTVATIMRSLSPGTFTSPQIVALTTSTPGATIRYTLSNTPVSATSPAYSQPLAVSTTTVLRAAGYREGWTPSAESIGTYTMNFGALDAPVLSAVTGSYTSGVTVGIEADSGVTVRYTTNGTNPTTSSAVYTVPLEIDVSQTVKAQAFHPDYTTSPVATATYTIFVAAPHVSLTSGSYPAGTAIVATSSTPGATVRYSLTGADPTETDPIWPEGGLIVGDYALRVRAFKAGCTSSTTLLYQYGVQGVFTAYRVGGRLSGGNSYAIRTDGTLWAWGSNSNGQLGDGTTTARPLPIQVGGLTGVSRVSAGNSHTLALRLGRVWSWGSGPNGQLGAGAVTYRTRPALIEGLTDVVMIATGSSHSVALRSDGTVWTWGANASGQLGHGNTTQVAVPTQITALAGVTAVAAGQTHTLAVRSDGTVWAWGLNTNGQLGDGSTTTRQAPVQVQTVTGIVAVEAGTSHSLAIGATGQLWGWGREDRFGINTTGNTLSPLAHPTLADVAQASAAGDSTLVQRIDGSVVAFGTNGNGQLGIWTNYQSTTPPVALGGSPPPSALVAMTGSHGLFTTADGVVYTWGYNGNGQLGDGTTTSWFLPTAISEPGMIWRLLEPTLGVPSGRYFTELAVTVTGVPGGALHYTLDGSDPTTASPSVASGSAVTISQSSVLTVRQFVVGAPPSQPVAAAYELQVPPPIIAPATGTYSTPPVVTMSAASGAQVRYTTDSQDPTPSAALYTAAVTVPTSTTIKATAFRVGWTPSVAAAASYWIPPGELAPPTLSPVGGTYVAPLVVTAASAMPGATVRYTLDGSVPSSLSPIYREPLLVGATSTVAARAFKAGASPSATVSATYITDDPSLAPTPTVSPAGGRFTTQQVVSITGPVGSTIRYTLNGVDPTETDTAVASGSTVLIDRATILKVRAWLPTVGASSVRREAYLITGDVDAGRTHSVALTASGDVYAWGDNVKSQVGVPGTTYYLSPVFVVAAVRAIAVGGDFTLALKQDGTLIAWGQNMYGQLGDGTNTVRGTPTAVAGLTEVVAIAAGQEHALALRADGSVWGWGRNTVGQVGDGTTVNRTSPVMLPGLHGVSAVRAGRDASLALADDGAGTGSLWVWGGNDAGQIGDGTTISRALPIRVAGLSDVRDVTAGDHWVLATTTSGTWTWGANGYGQLGDGTVSPRSSPVMLPTGQPLTRVDAGPLHALGIDAAGSVWGWGYSGWSQLGPPAVICPNLGCRVPIRLPSMVAALRASGGYMHSLALRADGRVLALGTNSSGQLGDGTTTVRDTPVVVPNLVLADNGALLSDPDADGLASWREFVLGTDPYDADTNRNGFSDGDELLAGSPSHPDPDGDGVPSSIERSRGTDPFLGDTDGDGVADGLDAFPLDPTRSSAPTPTPGDVTPPVITLTAPTSAQPYPPLP